MMDFRPRLYEREIQGMMVMPMLDGTCKIDLSVDYNNSLSELHAINIDIRLNDEIKNGKYINVVSTLCVVEFIGTSRDAGDIVRCIVHKVIITKGFNTTMKVAAYEQAKAIVNKIINKYFEAFDDMDGLLGLPLFV